jgi:tRNA dimethylallyltransferase
MSDAGLTPPSRPGHTPVFVLTGPTASGKTELAHALADRLGWRLLSADSMMVYRGMDLGTAKPPREEIERYDYAGLDLADPGERFSSGAWIRAVKSQLDDRPALAVGGTGLYLRALVHGLAEETEDPGPTDDRSAEELRAAIHALDPTALDRLADAQNPRRLARALYWLSSGRGLPANWTDLPKPIFPVLRLPTEDLDARIARRADWMLDNGLLTEAAALRDKHGDRLGTAAQAIGYAEAFAVLDGRLSLAEARLALVTRTRRYAKRQRTWFRNQVDARWVEGADAINQVLAAWKETGPIWVERGS